jgi:hypothetical protein
VCDALPQALEFFREKQRSWYFYALSVCDTLPQAAFFGNKCVPGIFMLCVCDALPQASFFRKKWRSWYFMTCTSPAEVLLPASSDSQMALAIFVMGQHQ